MTGGRRDPGRAKGRGPGPPSEGSALGPGSEFERIRSIVARLGAGTTGIGDDCALVADGPGLLVVSTDLSVEQVHFRTDWLSLGEIGWRAAAGALSDLAAAGARAVGILVSVGVPAGAAEGAPVELMEGAGEAVSAVGGVVLGGDLSRAGQWTVNVTVLGRAARPVGRAGARPGDGLWVTGRLGGSRAALAAWLRGEVPAPLARQAFAHPIPRLEAGQRLAAAGASAMIDLSDGLAGDAGHVAAASGCALDIDLALLPIHPDVAAQARLETTSDAEFAGQGGEDYELLVALPPGFAAEDAARLAQETGVPLTRIGLVSRGTGVRFHLGGTGVRLGGFDHFASGG